MWRREVDGLTLTFHLAGINNQNFLMRDEETGTFWQQISGAAVSGPLRGRTLELVHSDELTLGLWKSEQPAGTLVKDVPTYVSQYASKDWDVEMSRVPTVLSYAQPGLKPRTLILGIEAFGAVRAYVHDTVIAQKLVQDRVGGEPVLLVTGPDKQSIRAFRIRVTGVAGTPEFYRIEEPKAVMMDHATGTKWNFQGCAVDGELRGACLENLDIIKDYWFDWRHYHPDTSVYGVPAGAR